MEREQAIKEIRASWKQLYPADKKGKGIICPLCQSGSGKNGTGITGDSNHNKPNSLKCWSCGFTGDIIDLIQQDTGADFNTAINRAAAELNITIDNFNSVEQAKKDFSSVNDKNIGYEVKEPKTDTGAELDYTEYYNQCRGRLMDPQAASYLLARGISVETARAYNLGYDPEWKSPTVIKNQRAKGSSWEPEPTARIIMPVNKSYYVARVVDDNITEYKKMNEGKAGIFNSSAVYKEYKSIFIVEGIFDALSIIETGSAAIALNSTNNIDLLIKQLEQEPTKTTFIICLDNDEPGKRAAARLKEGLTRLDIDYITADICGAHKDPNEALIKDKKAFKRAIKNAEKQITPRPDNTSSYIDNFFNRDIANFKADKKTGFAELDRCSGGLYPGLYVLAAISSLGKTTFALQIADNLAAAGNDVLFFSMEQSRFELVSKSLARITKAHQLTQLTLFDEDPKYKKDNSIFPVTSLDIRKGAARDVVELAADRYKEQVGDRLNIIESNFNCDIQYIIDYIRRFIKKNNSSPVVFIDYLQILEPAEDSRRGTTKDIVDDAVKELKRISRENDITIMLVSSVNRSNYLTPIDFEALKESGGIEYTADVIWGLQLECLNEELFDKSTKIKAKRQRIREEKAKTPRRVELVCLKNRYGIANFSCPFEYYPKYDYFKHPKNMPFIEFVDDEEEQKIAENLYNKGELIAL